ncbi:MAG: tRNA (adenosine(37)-N6)-threonylcarbamoyltransferase complex dimerization subunit type 1 TsaB [Termitinemataceae bacterium]|nr:MAG: tRNA (adenosine(37)-N6)-threonylcarbamoyltransferase complex dimerization subunit type 1 TsaB [Termitinemataceae bacterium]
MTVLAVDTSQDFLSLGIMAATGQFFFEADAGTRHSELLFDTLEKLIDTAGIAKTDIDVLACMEGPGSFTGLRIGFSALKGIALALNKKMISVPTLDCTAFPFSDFPGLVAAVIDAKQNRFFSAIYRSGISLSSYMDIGHINLADIIINLQKNHKTENSILLCGNGAGLAKQALEPLLDGFNIFIDPEYRRGRAALMLKYIEKSYRFNSASDNYAFYCKPIYIRKSDAEMQVNK